MVQIDLDSIHTTTPKGLLLYRLKRNNTELNVYHLVIEVHYKDRSIVTRTTKMFRLIGKEKTNRPKGLTKIYLQFVESCFLVSSAIYLTTGLVKEFRIKGDKCLKCAIVILCRGTNEDLKSESHFCRLQRLKMSWLF